MEVTREIYWNIGHGVVIPMYILAFAAFGVMGWGFWQRQPIWRQGKALNRFDRYDERVKRMLSEVFSQSKIFRVTEGGIFHSIFFWSFLVLFVGTMLVMVQADFFTPVLKVNLLSGEFYKGFSLALDIAGLLALAMLIGLFVRRFIKSHAVLNRAIRIDPCSDTKGQVLCIAGLGCVVNLAGGSH